MAREWFSSKELTEIEGLPSTTQGINRKARVESWRSRKRSGVQGKAIEYNINSLPDFVKIALHAKEPNTAYTISAIEPLQLWISAFLSLNEDEQEFINTWLMRNGVKHFIHIIDQHRNKDD